MKTKSLILFLFCIIATTGLFGKPVTFKLRNLGAKAILLNIPDVMNPNLTAFSSSTVSLEKGQKIFFYAKNKKFLLLEVTDELEGSKISVNSLIKKIKRESE